MRYHTAFDPPFSVKIQSLDVTSLIFFPNQTPTHAYTLNHDQQLSYIGCYFQNPQAMRDIHIHYVRVCSIVYLLFYNETYHMNNEITKFSLYLCFQLGFPWLICRLTIGKAFSTRPIRSSSLIHYTSLTPFAYTCLAGVHIVDPLLSICNPLHTTLLFTSHHTTHLFPPIPPLPFLLLLLSPKIIKPISRHLQPQKIAQPIRRALYRILISSSLVVQHIYFHTSTIRTVVLLNGSDYLDNSHHRVRLWL